MTLSTLRPNATTSNTGALTGGATAHAVLSDDSDASFVTYDSIEHSLVGLTDLTLPAGAVIKSLAARLRTARVGTPNPNAGADPTAPLDELGVTDQTTLVTWTVATTTTIWTLTRAGITDAQVDGVSVSVSNAGLGVLRVYEAYLDVTYVTLPIVSADAPTGTITTTNRPTVVWSKTLDSAGGIQTTFEVKVFTDAVYGGGGFDPNTSTPAASSGVTADPNVQWQVDEVLADDTYRAYVRVAQTVNGLPHWSDWDFAEFTVDVDVPNSPVFAATGDNARVVLEVRDGGGPATTDSYELERSLDGGTTWERVRQLAEGAPNDPRVVATGLYATTADATSHGANLPAPAGGILAGDVLLAIAAFDGNPTVSWPAGWTEIKDEAGNASAVRVAAAWTRALGGETGTITVTTSVAESGCVHILGVRGAHATQAPAVSTGVNGSLANSADPDALNPGWGLESILWVAAMGMDGTASVTAGPSGYQDFRFSVAALEGGRLATAIRNLAAVSENPGAFTHGAEDVRAFTIAVRARQPTVTVYDYEAPNGAAADYRARALHDYGGVFAGSAWVQDPATWSHSGWHLKHPHQPALNTPVVVRSYQTRTRGGRQGVFQPLGGLVPVVVSDTRETERGTITLRLDSLAAQAALDALLDTAGTLLLHAPEDASPPSYIRVLAHERAKVVDRQDARRTYDTLEFVVVASPPGDVVAWP